MSTFSYAHEQLNTSIVDQAEDASSVQAGHVLSKSAKDRTKNSWPNVLQDLCQHRRLFT